MTFFAKTLSVGLLAVALAGCNQLVPASLKTACAAVGGHRSYTVEQLKVLGRSQKEMDKASNDFWDAHCVGKTA